MDKKTKLKEAIKAALAFALVYGIALKVNWLSPSWAGWSVAAIAATSSGAESLAKGFLRARGTVLACIAGIAIISLGAQDRWLFAFLTSAWLFFATYKMLANKKLSYFWFCAAYVSLVITAAGPSPAGGFYLAVFRTMETIMGIVVYALISVFLWPRTNIGAVKKSLSVQLGTQTGLFQELHKVLRGTDQLDHIKVLARQQVKQLGEFSQSLKVEGFENYQIQELLPLWNQFENLNNSLLRSLDRLFGAVEDLSSIDKLGPRPDIDTFFQEIDNRFKAMSGLFSGNETTFEFAEVKLTINSLNRQYISHFDKAVITIITAELNKIEGISRDMVGLALDLTDSKKSDQKNAIKFDKPKKSRGFHFPVLDIEYLKGSFYVSSVVIIGFVIWFYVNPPGHSKWYIMGGVLALLFAGVQQVKVVKLVIPFLIAMFLASLIYVFVLPELSMFYQLGIVLFACMFAIQYFLSGVATVVFTLVIIQLIIINNPQSYDASNLLNGFVFIPMLMLYLFGMSYLTNSPRPEKALLLLVSRFFKSAKYMISEQTGDTESRSFLDQYKIAFYQYELHTLPVKINAWGKAIDKELFPNTDYKKIEALVNALEVLVLRMETLMEAKRGSQKNTLIELIETGSNWNQRLVRTFESWDKIPQEEVKGYSSDLVLKRMEELEEKLKDFVTDNEDKMNEEEGIQFYYLLGGYRGVTEATLSYVSVADQLDWKQWKEERFQ